MLVKINEDFVIAFEGEISCNLFDRTIELIIKDGSLLVRASFPSVEEAKFKFCKIVQDANK